MKVVIYEVFNAPPQLKQFPDPTPETHGVVVKLVATGVGRSEWYGWARHDAEIQPLPYAAADSACDCRYSFRGYGRMTP